MDDEPLGLALKRIRMRLDEQLKEKAEVYIQNQKDIEQKEKNRYCNRKE